VADLRPCALSMRVTGLVALKRRGYLSVALRTDEPCRATVSARGFRSASAQLVPGRRTLLRLRGARRGNRRIAIAVSGVDAAGNATRLARSVRAR
jgi:hypothetical protein